MKKHPMSEAECLDELEQVRVDRDDCRENERIYRSLLDNSPVLIWMSNENAECNYFNKSWLDYTGKPLEEELGERFLDDLHPEDREDCVGKYRDYFGRRERFSFEFRLKHHSGVYQWFVNEGAPIYGENGAFEGYIGFCYNISDRKDAEKRLRLEENKYRRLVEALNEGIWVIDQKAETIYVNPKMTSILGYAESEMLGKHLFEFMDDRGREIATQKIKDRENGIKEQHEFELLKKDGARICVLIETAPLYDEAGSYIGAIAGVLDITKRKATEDSLRKLAVAVEQNATMVIITDTDGKVEYVNPKFYEITGFVEGEVIGQFTSILKTDKHDAQFFSQLWQTIKNGGVWKGEFHNKKKNGDCYFASATITPIRSDSGDITHYIAIEEDITLQKQLQAELEETNKLLQEANAYLQQLSKTDSLTNVYNHKAILDILFTEMERAKRYSEVLAIILLDIDHFKEINDTFGHQSGDVVLTRLADMFIKRLRVIDRIGRYGGEEFLFVLPNTDSHKAMFIAERIRKCVESSDFGIENLHVTISGGVAEYRDGERIDELIERADHLLYAAKKQGRNRFCKA